MRGQVVQLLTASNKSKEKRLVWCGFGDSISLRRGIVLRVFREYIDGEDTMIMTLLHADKFVCEHTLYPGECYDITSLAGLKVTPRALQMDNSGRGVRLLLEFVPTTDAARLAIQHSRG